MAISEVTVDELEQALGLGARLIDVREPDEYEQGHVAGAILVPLSTVPDNVDVFQSSEATYVICKAGGRSMRACEFLADHAIQTINVAGGTMAWQLSGKATVAGNQPS